MKKKIINWAVALILAVGAVFSLSACVRFDTGTEEIKYDYHETEIRQNIQNVADNGGVRIVLKIAKTTQVGEEIEIVPDEYYYLEYCATGKLYRYLDDEYEYIYDMRSDLAYDIYYRPLGGEWKRETNVYSDVTTTAEKIKEELNATTKDFFDAIFQHLEFEGDKMKKAETTVLGRACDRYYMNIKVLGVGINYNIAVDKETGVCMKMQCDVSAFKESESVSVFECSVFESTHAVEVPTTFTPADGDVTVEGEAEE